MVQISEIYKCAICGNIVEVVHASQGVLVCCGQPMTLLPSKTNEEGNEKHVPVIKNLKTKIRVRVGAKEHPMSPEHHIEFIEILADGKVYRKFLKHGDKPFAEFCIKADNVSARCYCNLHGLWKSQ
jgi:superoxide reductase